MKKIFMFFIMALFFIACNDSDPEEEIPFYYMIESITFSIEEGDGLKVEKNIAPPQLFTNNTSEFVDFSIKDSVVKYEDFIFIPEEHIPYDFPPDYSYRTFIPDSLDNGEIIYTGSFYTYEENQPINLYKRNYKIEDTYTIGPNTELSVISEEFIERLTLSYKINMFNGNDENITIKGKWIKTSNLRSATTAKATPINAN